jgi:glutamyl-tRNA synthetase
MPLPERDSQNAKMAGAAEDNGAGCGRFAPSPTGDLHLGNLRTALVSWLVARRAGAAWLVRMEDLDPITSSRQHATAQLRALEALGMSSDREVLFQSDRFDRYEAAIAELRSAGLVYECFCTRREIREAAQAPHGTTADLPDGAYPGTCRDLDEATRRRLAADGRRPALRLRTDGRALGFDDLIAGHVEAVVDDVVLRRNDGVPAYNLAVVVDDAEQGVTHVVRGDDLATSTPRQLLLQRLLGLPTPAYVHVPLVVGADGVRIAKRHGAITLEELAAAGIGPPRVLALLGASLGLCDPADDAGLAELLAAFAIERIPRRPYPLRELLGDADVPGVV